MHGGRRDGAQGFQGRPREIAAIGFQPLDDAHDAVRGEGMVDDGAVCRQGEGRQILRVAGDDGDTILRDGGGEGGQVLSRDVMRGEAGVDGVRAG